MLIGRREFSLLDSGPDEIDGFAGEVKAFVDGRDLPQDYKVDVYKDQVACCGIFTIGVAIEYEGPDEAIIKDLDTMLYSKVIEICERQAIEFHESTTLEILS
jgi:hypothetical protein